jgi:N-acetylglucosaminyl-diphospho-decaprenol L-rhamnosyltransferase
MTGASWLHHYGSVTQTAMKQERGLSAKQGLGYRYNYRLLQQSWLKRKLKKMHRLRQLKQWRDNELAHYDMTMHGSRVDNHFRWQ